MILVEPPGCWTRWSRTCPICAGGLGTNIESFVWRWSGGWPRWSIPEILEGVVSAEDERERSFYFDCLACLGEAALPYLVELARREDRLVGSAAVMAMALRRLADERALPALLRTLEVRPESTVAEAVVACCGTGRAHLLPDLFQALECCAESVRSYLFRAVARIGEAAGIPGLRRYLDEPGAVEALWRINHPDG